MVRDYLIRLEATRHAVLVDAAAAVGQAAFTDILSAAGSIYIAAAVNQQVFSFANITWKTKKQTAIKGGCYKSVR